MILSIIHLAGNPLNIVAQSFAMDSQFGSCIACVCWNIMITIISFVLALNCLKFDVRTFS